MDDGAGDRMHLRVSDAERHQVAEVLREAAGQGRLGLDELDERLEAAYAARTYGDLAPLTADLPGQHAPAPTHLPRAPVRAGGPPTSPVPVPRRNSSIAVMSSTSRRGVWQPGDGEGGGHTAFALMGSVELDLRDAVIDPRLGALHVTAYAVMGSVDVVVDARTVVDVDGVGVMGDFTQARDKVRHEPDEDSPRVVVRGLALMGSVTVRRKGPRGPGVGQRLRGMLPPPA